MKQSLKCFIYFFMLTVAALPVLLAGYFIAGRIIAGYKAFEQIEQGNSITLMVARNQIQWIDKGEELTVDGKLFDVHRFREKNDSLEITGIFDINEDLLYEKYKGIINDKKQNSPFELSLFSIFFHPALAVTTIPAEAHQGIMLTLLYPPLFENPADIFYHIAGPPPKYIPASFI